VVRRSRTGSGPEARTIACGDGHVVDACFPASPYAALVHLPPLMTITAVPWAGIGVLLVWEAHADPVVGTCPQSLHEADRQCTRPVHATPPAPPAPASPYELYNFRANHEPCANRGPERLRVVSRGRAHPPPCRHVGTCDHMSSPSAGGVLEGSLSALVACRAGRAATHCGGRAPGRGEHWHRTCAMSVQPQCSPAGGIAGHAIRVQQRLGATGLRHVLATGQVVRGFCRKFSSLNL
jgi:hypothetical protein